MDYTREPIVESVITAKDGYRIAVRNSKNPGQDEFLVDALEVVSFGAHCFFRNLERPRAFMVPASDYEVLEVREMRVPLKAPSLEGTVKTPTPREVSKPSPKEKEKREKPVPTPKELMVSFEEAEEISPVEEIAEAAVPVAAAEVRPERRRERRRGQRRRRGSREEEAAEEAREGAGEVAQPEPRRGEELPPTRIEVPLTVQPPIASTPAISTVIPPPTTLIRDDLERLRRNKQYEGAFYIREPEEVKSEEPDDDDAPVVPLRLQGEEETRVPEEPPVRPQEENIYKATPAPLEEDDPALS